MLITGIDSSYPMQVRLGYARYSEFENWVTTRNSDQTMPVVLEDSNRMQAKTAIVLGSIVGFVLLVARILLP
jgi:hypothetical protein